MLALTCTLKLPKLRHFIIRNDLRSSSSTVRRTHTYHWLGEDTLGKNRQLFSRGDQLSMMRRCPTPACITFSKSMQGRMAHIQMTSNPFHASSVTHHLHEAPRRRLHWDRAQINLQLQAAPPRSVSALMRLDTWMDPGAMPAAGRIPPEPADATGNSTACCTPLKRDSKFLKMGTRSFKLMTADKCTKGSVSIGSFNGVAKERCKCKDVTRCKRRRRSEDTEEPLD